MRAKNKRKKSDNGKTTKKVAKTKTETPAKEKARPKTVEKKKKSARKPAVETADGDTVAKSAHAAVVRDFLDKIDFKYIEKLIGGDFMFEGIVCGNPGLIDVFHFNIIVEDECVQSIFEIPTHVVEERRAAVAAFFSAVNYTIKFGKFVEDFVDDGELSFRLCFPVSVLDGDPDTEVDRLIGMPLAILSHYMSAIISVIQGADPRKALEDCEQDDEPESPPEDGVGGKKISLTDGMTPAEMEEERSEAIEKPSEEAKRPSKEAKQTGENADDPAEDYSLDGLNVQGDVPLAKVVAAVRKFRDAREKGEDAPRMNILLSGPSGCGKTEFVKYLGRETGSEVVTVSASDVLSPMVGQTERNLAKLFRKARESKSILFLDEVDSLLSSRKYATHSWEVTQVNELLQQMERFGGIMVGATNFETSLDAAVTRRFTFKLKMDYLTTEGKKTFFARYFKTPLSAAEDARLEAIQKLTPGDFRTARQKLYYLSDSPCNDNRLAALEAESAARGAKHPRIGF